MAATPDATMRRTRLLAVLLALGLIVLGLTWELILAPTGARSLALKVLPLAFVMPGLLKLRLSTFRATSLLVWLYVGEGLLRGASDRGASVPLAWLEAALGVALFVVCGLHVRHRLRAAKAANLQAATS